ncbi:TIGR01440 family protein [Macrococcus hajekii]|uniref:UPF0340 protein ERX37_10550 n=1 Tax=Macrococcus hajekii TaxID=198482 RepID=A0A4V3BDR5_9STAP|nr:TIGR01440 family protein [Macrococcus hajekii]TDM01112.1 TIGR01440 family protein [Macrococcus hajekii]GGB12329.1 UPF0340 protein [Macrococcus hajekii]
MTDIKQLLDELMAIQFFKKDEVCIIGCSTSEVIGERIGTNSSDEVAAMFFQAFKEISDATGVHFVFQGCEHINRAITLEKSLADRLRVPAVSVVPVRKAGGSMSAYAYQHMTAPVVVEHIHADCGIDIGQTLIGMHIKHVQIPVRVTTERVGQAVVTIATHRPKLIGGPRAQYE